MNPADLRGRQGSAAERGSRFVLRDLIASGRIPLTLLTVSNRQDDGSQIVEAAHAINRRELPVAGWTAAGDLYILCAQAPSKDGGLQAQRLKVESAVRLEAQVITRSTLRASEVRLSSDLLFRVGDRSRPDGAEVLDTPTRGNGVPHLDRLLIRHNLMSWVRCRRVSR